MLCPGTGVSHLALVAGGATCPNGVAIGINQMMDAAGLGWTATARTHGTLASLMQELDRGDPVVVLLVYDFLSAHWVTLTGYDSGTGTVSYVDPSLLAPGAKPSVKAMSVDRFMGYWGDYAGWNDDFQRSYVVLTPLPSCPRPVPTPAHPY